MANNFCEKCGTRREGDAHFCMKCGFRFEDTAQATDVQEFDDAEIAEAMQIVREEEVKELSDAEYSLPVQTAHQETQINTESPMKVKKASYKGEVLLLMLSLICFIGSLGFFLATKTEVLDSIPVIYNLKHPDAQNEEEIPVLTADMAAEVLNKATGFPYYHFEAEGMFDEDDYIIHPTSQYTGYDVKCYAAKGIETLDDYYTYFEKFGTREFIEENLTRDFFYEMKGEKPYFSPNEWMGWEAYISDSLCVEMIDSETYFIRQSGYDQGVVLKYIDGVFKATKIRPEEAAESYSDKDATISLPEIELGMSLDRAERELNKLGLKLDRNDITYVKQYWGDMGGYDHYVSAFKESYIKHKMGDSIGVFVVVENPDTYVAGSVPAEVTDDYARELLINASAVEMKWLQFLYRFTDEKAEYDDLDRCHYVDRNDYITINSNGFDFQAYAVVDDQIKSVADLKALYNRYFDKEYSEKACNGYVDSDGKLYVPVGDAGLWEPCSEYTDSIEKISDDHYRYCITGMSDYEYRTVSTYYDIVLEEGKWVFTQRFADEYKDAFFYGFMPIEDAANRISD